MAVIAVKHVIMSAMLTLVIILIAASSDFAAAQIGVAYGRNGNGLPLPAQVVALYKQYGIQRMRIYDTDRETLEALRNSDIEVTVGILNPDLQPIAAAQENADAWVRDNIRNFPDVKFRHIVVGNEVSPIRGDTSQYGPFVLPAMQNVHNALSDLGIKVTTAIETEVLDPSQNFPPENGVFKPEVTPYLNPIIQFLVSTDAPLLVTIYPYFAYLSDPEHIDERYALLDPNYPGVETPGGVYQNLFYALVDTMNAALEKSVASMVASEMSAADAGMRPPVVKGGESGHSTRRGPPRPPASAGDDNDDVDNDFASVDNARTYVNNLIQAVKNGTPKRPGQYIETYIFAMFDEDMKPGDEDEKHFGLFSADKQPKYSVNFN